MLTDKTMIDIQYGAIPEATVDTLKRYAEDRCPTGGFMNAVLCNDLFGAMGRADIENRYAIWNICAYIANELPPQSYGSREKVKEWLGGRDNG